ncbi:hypothetical protein MNBD_GAMMA12-1695 [hydrothermal vent metagenome]|uniref:Uncharacterized protein n=1 Tax=hydrothermal vent metagenome TaxID=652676 RepID=A0A3B0XXM4_9ZZZZ
MIEEKSVQNNVKNERRVTYFTLFSTTGTLVCCALPIIFVTLGLGASVAAFTNEFPFFISLTRDYKEEVFIFSGAMLAVSGWLMYRPGRVCPTDPELGKKCSSAHKWNKRIYWTSVVIWCVGFFAAFLALPLQIWLDS